MADSSLSSLLSTKAALDLGLISQADFDAVKNSFLRAQQIKAAVDVGLIKDQDYESAKQEYLGSLLGNAGTPTGSAPQLQPAPKAQANGSSIAAAPIQQQQQRQAPPPLRPPVAPVPAAQPAAAQSVRQRPDSPAQLPPTSRGPTRSGSASTLTAEDGTLPANIPKVGGSKSASSGGTSMSGIVVSDDAVNLYYLMRLKATYKWALWQIDDAGKEVVIAAVGEKGSSYADFVAALPESDCRYGVFDYQYTTPDGQQLSKLVFLNWAPDNARVKSKMMYASTKDFFKQMLDGLSVEFQASELDEVQEEEVAAAVKALKRS